MKAARAAYRTRQISAPSLGLPVKMAEDSRSYMAFSKGDSNAAQC